MLRDLDFDHNLNLNDYVINELIGKRFETSVFAAFDSRLKRDVEIKIIPITMRQLNKHYEIITCINSLGLQGVVKIFGFNYFNLNDIQKYFNTQDLPYNDNYIYFVGSFEKTKNLSLEDIVSKTDKFNPTIISKIIYGIASTMKSLHKINFFYRDLKPSNILLNENFEPKLEFSLFSKFIKEEEITNSQNNFGTMYYAPEADYHIKVSTPADVFSFALIICDVFDAIPYKNNLLKLFQTKKSYRDMIKQDKIPSNYWNLIYKCLEQNPDDRPTFNEIVEILKNDEFYSFEENGEKIDLNQLHEYQNRLEKK